jgi:hypothetical protein
MHRSHKIALAFVSVASLAAAQVASAQPYDERQVYADQCQEQRTGHTILGAVIGGLAGAVIGNQVSHGNGTAWGGVAGAAVGAGVGNAADCNPQRYGDNYGRGDRYGDDYGRGNRYGDDYSRGDRYGDDYGRDRYGSDYGRDGADYRGPDGYQGDPSGYAYDEPSYRYDDPY